ncbi:hypothetical protein Leryth_006004 [Lithospermum erythrorhizon]|nr:hypothetical protein Leryth_006004 [Lithospermum erythrorhizon]
MAETTINDIPDVLLSNIISGISSVRSRNSASLVCRKWLTLERSTRTHLTLRGNIKDLFILPTCFTSVTHLDLSLLSPWGNPLFSTTTSAADPFLLSHLLRRAFPSVASLTIYARNPSIFTYLASQWHFIKHVKLVRWHQRPQLASGEELDELFKVAFELTSIDFSSYYCWTDDIPPVLESHPNVSSRLTSLDLLNPSFSEGFKSDEIKAITKSCPSLSFFKVVCMFDPRYHGHVGDEAVSAIAVNCKKLSVLHLADVSALCNARKDPDDDGFAQEDAVITVATLIELFSGLPLLEDLAIDVCNNVRDSGPALEVLHSRCLKLRCLKLGQFHGISMPVESKLDGVALCQKLESLSIRNVADLTDMGLIAIGRGCLRLSKFEVQGCKKITVRGMRTLASLLSKTLVDVKISCCKNLGAESSLKALEPVQNRIKRLHIDCIWVSIEQSLNLDGIEYNFDLNELNGETDDGDVCHREKRMKFSYDLNSSFDEFDGNADGYGGRTWDKLETLSLWIPVDELLTPLAATGLEDCPNLEEVRIKVEGDCRDWLKPSGQEFGLSSLIQYPKLSKMQLDCGDIIGFAHTAPPGQVDLSLWERFYLLGIGHLTLNELDYWPPQDRDVNRRSLTLPAAGLLQECLSLRKLFIHGTTHEHFLNFFLRIPDLRDVQLREDYYPAPENDMSTEMRADSLSRFEASLNKRQICD